MEQQAGVPFQAPLLNRPLRRVSDVTPPMPHGVHVFLSCIVIPSNLVRPVPVPRLAWPPPNRPTESGFTPQRGRWMLLRFIKWRFVVGRRSEKEVKASVV